ncbi:hypothetical protein N0V84_000456 [Fusarium piperis]|uniref:Clr5 domain-containing protein n=1 Tax=Fusarium piperis TaxID=1435070 RepID=A0A9W8WMY9_9HYPO|nr:hypothetical protein N0V84_000456 [Fusarium piperis]
MAIDWKLYERDVNRWYLDEAKTANDVIKLLREKHNLQVTLRQFKAKFGGCKKISSKEWSILIPKIQEREANGLGSVIYVCGKAVKRENLGIDTISQHRIEIRTTSRSERRLPSDNSAAEIQSSHKGERTLEPQNDELGIGQEFGLAGMDVGFPSPSMFLRALDQLPLDMLTIPFIPDTSEIPMDSDGMVPFNSGRALLSPSLDPTTWFSFRHSFTSFWDSPGT